MVQLRICVVLLDLWQRSVSGYVERAVEGLGQSHQELRAVPSKVIAVLQSVGRYKTGKPTLRSAAGGIDVIELNARS